MNITIGTVQFGLDYGYNLEKKISYKNASEIINYAKKSSINSIDTAISYGDSQKVLGRIGVNSFDVISKIPSFNKTKKNILNAIINLTSSSINSLKIKSLHAMLLHNPNDIFSDNGDQVLESLDILKDKGFIKKTGISIYDPNELLPLLDKYNFDIVQLPINPFDRRLLNSDYLGILKEKKIEIHARSIFLQGLLLEDNYPKKFNKWKNAFDLWDSFINLNSLSKLEACINFIKSFDFIENIVIGVRNKHELKEILDIYNKPLIKIDFPAFISSKEKILINPSLWNSII